MPSASSFNFAEIQADFAFRIFSKISAHQSDNNNGHIDAAEFQNEKNSSLVISPFSIFLALECLRSGSKNKTKDQISRLFCSYLSSESQSTSTVLPKNLHNHDTALDNSIGENFRKIIDFLDRQGLKSSDSFIALKIASRLYCSKQVDILLSYQDYLVRHFKSDIIKADIRNNPK